jgi:hypothetical protein
MITGGCLASRLQLCGTTWVRAIFGAATFINVKQMDYELNNPAMQSQ